jgi:hypothetical protein
MGEIDGIFGLERKLGPSSRIFSEYEMYDLYNCSDLDATIKSQHLKCKRYVDKT